MRRDLAAGLLLAVLVVTAGCRPQGARTPAATPTPAAEVTPRPYTVAVVDLPSVLRAHRRWPELEALFKKIETLQVRLASPPLPPPLPPTDFGKELQAEADRLQAAMQAELRELEEQAKQRLEAFVNDLRAEQEAKLAERQRQANAELQRVLEVKRDELQRELEKFELATMAEYRIPLLNLRLKADVVGVSNEEEAKRINEEADRLTKERDGKIRARAQDLDKTFQEFQKAKTGEVEAQLKALVATLEVEGNARINVKAAESRAELDAALKERDATLRRAMEERQKVLIGGAEEQLRQAQERHAHQIRAENARLQGELQALSEQRFRLEDSVLAEIKIEIASVAQERKVDAVLTRAVAAAGAIDLTQAVIARTRR